MVALRVDGVGDVSEQILHEVVTAVAQGLLLASVNGGLDI